ncbi:MULTISPECIES: CS1 type fimbrial major subunit [Pseudomonas]|uniref:Fimbrial assembly protein n=1 Tax=Pseudomonas aphyarum TaxID=2942629 RepID=A0ABT5PJ70_9PSED|nr:CS1 type fimbrial major subunit [Pseudomonas aphyarum]MDD0970657.1 fimbrial assembly protein [Pseudomonas aphyarum]MDD1123943.1 fimbrial assembly protein [Pseudomonas aphyarum]
MNKQSVAAALMAVTALTSATVWAAREELNFEVFLTIPSRAFYVTPAEPDWIHRPQRLLWDYNTSTLRGLRKSFDLRHDSSAIEARLESTGRLSNGRLDEDILLHVKFNGVVMGSDPRPREVLSQAEAAVGKRVLLEIDPIQPLSGFKPGDYNGTVMLLFSAKAPGN